MKRRDFIQVMLPIAGLPVVWPMWSYAKPLLGKGRPNQKFDYPNDGRVLVLIQLAGGNDGLNTVVPYRNDVYYRERPQLAIPANEVIKLNDEIGLHNNMSALRPLYDAGGFALVQGVGYPNPDRSHFRSTDIWLTGSGSQEVEDTGWLGRYFDHVCPEGESCGAFGPPAIQIGLTSSLALLGREQKGIALQNPVQFYQLVNRQGGHDPHPHPEPTTPAGRELEFLYDTAAAAFQYAGEIVQAYESKENLIAYPEEFLAEQLAIVARMIAGGLSTRVYIVSMRGFDTHAGQAGVHGTLLGQLAAALAVFQKDLELLGIAERVAGICFSEFGRRVKQNASFGTDHGTAAPMIAFGRPVNGGVYGAHPSLTELEQGDLKHVFDYRQIYATLLQHWLMSDPAVVLGENFTTLPLFKTATRVEEPASLPESFYLMQNYPNPFNPQTTIAYGLPHPAHVKLTIMNSLGQEVETLIEGWQNSGRHSVTWTSNGHASGAYFFKLRAGGFEETKRMSLVK